MLSRTKIPLIHPPRAQETFKDIIWHQRQRSCITTDPLERISRFFLPYLRPRITKTWTLVFWIQRVKDQRTRKSTQISNNMAMAVFFARLLTFRVFFFPVKSPPSVIAGNMYVHPGDRPMWHQDSSFKTLVFLLASLSFISWLGCFALRSRSVPSILMQLLELRLGLYNSALQRVLRTVPSSSTVDERCWLICHR